ncbi:hypothetical protein F2Q68_00040164 [Brassica cretica]|uniref:Uncharacterized protein n=1 Tax=Brassica cretica TaxID=69181 RepID=A0A8S9MEQ7_BRACR|nr:hypothetical protein F2Q68_00040164 [Brassica cretica]
MVRLDVVELWYPWKAMDRDTNIVKKSPRQTENAEITPRSSSCRTENLRRDSPHDNLQDIIKFWPFAGIVTREKRSDHERVRRFDGSLLCCCDTPRTLNKIIETDLVKPVRRRDVRQRDRKCDVAMAMVDLSTTRSLLVGIDLDVTTRCHLGNKSYSSRTCHLSRVSPHGSRVSSSRQTCCGRDSRRKRQAPEILHVLLSSRAVFVTLRQELDEVTHKTQERAVDSIGRDQARELCRDSACELCCNLLRQRKIRQDDDDSLLYKSPTAFFSIETQLGKMVLFGPTCFSLCLTIKPEVFELRMIQAVSCLALHGYHHLSMAELRPSRITELTDFDQIPSRSIVVHLGKVFIFMMTELQTGRQNNSHSRFSSFLGRYFNQRIDLYETGLLPIKQPRQRNNLQRCRRGGDIVGRRRISAVRSSLSQFVEQDECRSGIENFCGVSLMFFALETNEASPHLLQHAEKLLRNLRAFDLSVNGVIRAVLIVFLNVSYQKVVASTSLFMYGSVVAGISPKGMTRTMLLRHLLGLRRRRWSRHKHS